MEIILQKKYRFIVSLVLFVAFIASVALLWTTDLVLSPDIGPSTAVTFDGGDTTQITSDLNNAYDIQKFEIINAGAEDEALRAYILSDTTVEDIQSKLTNSEGIIISVDRVIPHYDLTVGAIASFIIPLALFVLCIVFVVHVSKLGVWKALYSGLVMVDILFVVLGVVLGVAVVLNILGWQISPLSVDFFQIIAYVVASILIIVGFIFSSYNQKLSSVSENYVAMVSEHGKGLAVWGITSIVVFAPLLLLYDLRVEVLLLIGSIVGTIASVVVLYPTEVEILPDAKGKNKKARSKKAKK
jgi:hypothetical protein